MTYRDRRYVASFYVHNGNRNQTGNPTYDDLEDWYQVAYDYYCEKINSSGGETVRGRQVTDQTSFVLVGDYWGARAIGVSAPMQVEIEGIRGNVISAEDIDGQQLEMMIQVEIER